SPTAMSPAARSVHVRRRRAAASRRLRRGRSLLARFCLAWALLEAPLAWCGLRERGGQPCRQREWIARQVAIAVASRDQAEQLELAERTQQLARIAARAEQPPRRVAPVADQLEHAFQVRLDAGAR